MNPVWIWVGALAIYGVFSLWYNNWKGPLSAADRTEARRERVRPASPVEKRVESMCAAAGASPSSIVVFSRSDCSP